MKIILSNVCYDKSKDVLNLVISNKNIKFDINILNEILQNIKTIGMSTNLLNSYQGSFHEKKNKERNL